MRVIEALRYIHAEWVMFGDMDENDCHKVFTKPMKTKNIPWDRIRRIERYVSKILATTIIIITSPLWVVPYLVFHACDIMEGL